MLPRRCATKQRQFAIMRIAICSGLFGLSFFAIAGSAPFSRRTQAAERTLPDRRASAAPKRIQARPAANYGRLPLGFEANQGQVDAGVRYVVRGGGYTIFLTDTEAVLTLKKASAGVADFEAGICRTNARRYNLRCQAPNGPQ